MQNDSFITVHKKKRAKTCNIKHELNSSHIINSWKNRVTRLDDLVALVIMNLRMILHFYMIFEFQAAILALMWIFAVFFAKVPVQFVCSLERSRAFVAYELLDT